MAGAFRSAPIALVLYSPATGKSVQVAGLVQDGTCEGWQTAPGEITFFGALEGLADLRFRNELGQFHQEILLTGKISPKTLVRLGFSSDLSAQPLRLEIWSEFLESPEPAIQTTLLKTESDPLRRAATVEPDTTDTFLDFGAAKLARGVAFAEAQPGQSIPVFKQWLEDPQTGRRYLVEACDYAELLPLLAPLEEATLASLSPATSTNKTLLAQNGARTSIHINSPADASSPLRLLGERGQGRGGPCF